MADKSNGQQASKGISKVEAVRRALTDLGQDAKPAAIQPYVKQKFGLDMTPEHITTCKGTLKKGDKGKPAAPKPAVAPTPAAPKPQAVAPAPQAGNGKPAGMSKFDAVKRAMADLGPDAMPLAIKDYLKTRLGIEISADVASNYKKQLKKSGTKSAASKPAAPKPQIPAATAKPAAPRPQPQPPAAPKATAPKAQPAAAAAPKAEPTKPAGGVSLQDIGTVKHLLGRVGPDSLRTLIDLLAR